MALPVTMVATHKKILFGGWWTLTWWFLKSGGFLKKNMFQFFIINEFKDIGWTSLFLTDHRTVKPWLQYRLSNRSSHKKNIHKILSMNRTTQRLQQLLQLILITCCMFLINPQKWMKCGCDEHLCLKPPVGSEIWSLNHPPKTWGKKIDTLARRVT